MLALSSVPDLLTALAGARAVEVDAYTLARGPVVAALEAAAARGARVRVRLQGSPVPGTGDGIARANAALARELAAGGVDAGVTGPGDPPLHTKRVTIDGTLYLDARNFARGDLLLRDDDPGDPQVAGAKRSAQAIERATLADASPASDAIVESESFGCCNAVWAGLRDLARAGAAPRLLVSARELRGNLRERAVLDDLAQRGVRIRVTQTTDKLAAAGARAWLGSANATAAIATPDESDWGVASGDPAIVAAVRARFERNWSAARPLAAVGA